MPASEPARFIGRISGVSAAPAPRVGLAEKRTDLAKYRTQLALDRTALAWIRTALTMATFGFGTVGFFRSLRAAAPTPEAVHLHQGAIAFGVRLVVLGIVATVAEHTEVESGRKARRPELLAAIREAKMQKATLVIARLDRLARNVAFLAMR